jgi:hypothetical protein
MCDILVIVKNVNIIRSTLLRMTLNEVEWVKMKNEWLKSKDFLSVAEKYINFTL